MGAKILEHNESAGKHDPSAYRYVDSVPSEERLSRMRSFVVYYLETTLTRDEYGRPCHRVEREEIARGQA